MGIPEGDEFGSRAVKPTEYTHNAPRSAESGSMGIPEGDEFGSRAVKPTEYTHNAPRSAEADQWASPKGMNSVAVR